MNVKNKIAASLMVLGLSMGAGACVAGTASGQGGEPAGKSSSQHPSQFASVLIPEDQEALINAGFKYFRSHFSRDFAIQEGQALVTQGRAREFRIIQAEDGTWMVWSR